MRAKTNFPRQRGANGKWLPKSEKEIQQEADDAKEIEEKCKKDTMAEAARVFGEYNGAEVGGNPWGESVGRSMFWM